MKTVFLILFLSLMHAANAQLADSINKKEASPGSVIRPLLKPLATSFGLHAFNTTAKGVLARTTHHNSQLYWHPVEQRLVPYRFRSVYKENWFTNAANFAAEFLLLNPEFKR